MLAGLVHTSQSLALRVAFITEGVDVEFGETATKAPFQRFDIFDADSMRVQRILKLFPSVKVGKSKRKVKLGDASLLKRPELIPSKEA
jgi:hypothetical protein